jgi:hypothetical protein
MMRKPLLALALGLVLLCASPHGGFWELVEDAAKRIP